jgi:hypothetical protein
MILQIKFINCYSILTFLQAHMLHQIGQTNLLLAYLPYKSQKEDIKHPLMNFVGVNAWFYTPFNSWTSMVNTCHAKCMTNFLLCIYCHTSLNLNPLSFRSQGKSHITTSSLISFVCKQQCLNSF